jgi:hypothetical protein
VDSCEALESFHYSLEVVPGHEWIRTEQKWDVLHKDISRFSPPPERMPWSLRHVHKAELVQVVISRLFFFFLLRIFLNYISNAIPKVPHTLPPPLPYPLIPIFFFGPGITLYWGIYSLHVQWASLSSDGRLGHLLIHLQLESRALGYWLVHNVVPPIGLPSKLDIDSLPLFLLVGSIVSSI